MFDPFGIFEEQQKQKKDEAAFPPKVEEEIIDQPLTKDQVNIYLSNINNPKISLEVRDRLANVLINAWKKGLIK